MNILLYTYIYSVMEGSTLLKLPKVSFIENVDRQIGGNK